MKYNIVGGPSKFHLMIAFFDRLNGHRRSIEFQYNNEIVGTGVERVTSKSGRVQIVINALMWEDGSGNNWCFKGFLVNNHAEVHGYFNTERRRGWYQEGKATW